MSKMRLAFSLCFSLFFVSSAFAPSTFAADVETLGDLKVSGFIDNTGGDGIIFPNGSTQASACSCAYGILPVTLGGTGGDTATDARTNLSVPGLATSNTFTTGTQTILTGATGNNGLVVQGFLGQTADLQQWKQSLPLPSYVVASVGSNGDIATSGNVSAAGQIESTGGGFKFPDTTVQTTAASPPWSQILPAAERFVLVMANAAVLDKETGLVWQRDTPGLFTTTWQAAHLDCYDLYLGGRKGWRLPSVDELSSLVDPAQSNPALPSGHPFTNVKSGKYWSSTTLTYNANDAWVVHFGNGQVLDSSKVSTAKAMSGACVADSRLLGLMICL